MKSNLIDFTFKLFKKLLEHNIVLVYQGVITHSIIATFTKVIENSLKERNQSNKTLKKVFNIMVESLQNISQHSHSIDKVFSEKGCGIILISEDDKYFHITTGNIVDEKAKNIISENINNVNSLDKSGLSDLFKDKLSTGRISEKGGAGLGFIDMRKKSDNKIEYFFQPLEDNLFFYVINVKTAKL